MGFYVGQKVVCVDDRPEPGLRWTGPRPTVGEVYTVGGQFYLNLRGRQCMHIVEIKNAAPGNAGFLCARFRPLRTTNIDVFRKMLEPQPVKELTHG